MTDDTPDVDGEGVTRRRFIELSAAAVAATPGGMNPQLGLEEQQTQSVDGLTESVQTPALLLGPADAKPDPGSDYFSQWNTGPELLYVAFSGEQWRYDPNNSEWITVSDMPQTQLDEVLISEYRSQFNHTFAVPNGEAPSSLRWDWSSVTHDTPEVAVTATNYIESAEYGNYAPGSEAAPGLAFRVTAAPSSGSGYGGYYDASNGFGAGEDATDSYVFLRKGGAEVKVHREDWNGYVPDSRVWVSDSPIVTRFPHLYYGGGSIDVTALLHIDGEAELKTLHRFTPADTPGGAAGPPTDNPNLPIRVDADSLTPEIRINAAHYERGEQEADFRVNGDRRPSTSVGTTDWTPLISWRKRSGWDNVNVRPVKIGAQADTDMELRLILGSSLTGASFRLPPFTDSTETALEYDISATSMSQSAGQSRWVSQISGGQGNKDGASVSADVDFNLPANNIVTLAAKADSNGSVTAVVMNGEEF